MSDRLKEMARLMALGHSRQEAKMLTFHMTMTPMGIRVERDVDYTKPRTKEELLRGSSLSEALRTRPK